MWMVPLTHTLWDKVPFIWMCIKGTRNLRSLILPFFGYIPAPPHTPSPIPCQECLHGVLKVHDLKVHDPTASKQVHALTA